MHENDAKQTPPKLARYEFSLSGGGVARLEIIWTELSADDLQDLRTWVALIDRRLERLATPSADPAQPATQKEMP